MSIENKHAGLRITLAAAAALTVAGVAIGKTMRDELEKAKVAASEPVVPGKSTLENPTPEASPSATLQVRQMTATEIATTYPTATRIPETPTTAPATETPFPPTARLTEKPTTVPDTATAVPPVKVQNTATAVPATKVPDKTPTALATPETNRFVPYGVYANEDTLVATLPDGRIVVGAKKVAYPCSNDNYYVFNFVTSSKYSPEKNSVWFNDQNATAREITISLMGDGNKLAMVILKEKGHVERAPAGEFTCPATEERSKVAQVGMGKNALVSYAQKVGVVSRTDTVKALQQLEQMVGKLPD